MTKFAQKALKHLQKCVELQPSFIAAQITLSEFFIKEGRMSEGLDQVAKALKDSPSNPTLWYLKSKIEYKNNLIEEAASSIKQALKELPDDIEILDHALKISTIQGNQQLRLNLLEKLLVLVDEKSIYCLELAKAKFSSGLILDAQKFFDLAIEFIPNDEICLFEAAKFYFVCGKDLDPQGLEKSTSKVKALLSKIIFINPSNHDAKIMLSDIHFTKFEYRDAYILLQESYGQDIRKEKYLIRLYRTSNALDDFKSAKNFLNQAYENRNTRGLASFYLSEIALKKKKDSCAELSLRSIFHLRKNLRREVKEFNSLNLKNDFYNAGQVLLNIDELSEFLSKAYLIYYLYSLHKLRKIKPKALSQHKSYKRNAEL